MNAPELLADMEWLSRLAHRMVRDPALADDAVQDAWLAAKRRQAARGVSEAPDRGLLSRTLRGIVLHARRAARRRQHHEAAAARREALPSTDELLLIGERQQTLWRHLAALEEPFRSTLLLRFQRSLSTRDIASHQGEKEDTVRWRVRRGLELLKESLEREDAGPGLLGMVPVAALSVHPWKAAATGVASSGTATGGTILAHAGALWMTNKLLIGTAAALLAVAALLWNAEGITAEVPGDRSASAKAEAVDLHPAGQQEELGALEPFERSAEARRPGWVAARSKAAGSASTAPQAPPTSVATGVVVDRTGRPVSGAPVALERHRHWKRTSTTDIDGRFEVECPRQTTGRVSLKVEPTGFHGAAYARFGDTAGCDAPPLSIDRVDVGKIIAPPAGVARGFVVDESGAPIAGARLFANPPYHATEADATGAFVLRGCDLGDNYLRVSADGFADLRLPLDLQPDEAAELGVLELEPLGRIRVTGDVLDENGRPIPGAVVSDGVEKVDVEVGADGRFRYDALGDRQAYLTAAAPGYRESDNQICEDGSTAHFVLHSSGPLCLFKIIDRETKEPISGAEIAIRVAPGAELPQGTSRSIRFAHAPEPQKRPRARVSSSDGLLEAYLDRSLDRLTITAPGFEQRTASAGPPNRNGRAQVVRMRRQRRATVRGEVPPGLAAAAGARVEIQVMERLTTVVDDEGVPARNWVTPPPSVQGAAQVARWVGEEPALRVKTRHLTHVDANGGFVYSHGERAMARAVFRIDSAGVAISPLFVLNLESEVEAGPMTPCEWGALDGHVHLPHPGLAASLRMRLEGANQGDLVVDAQGRFFADRLIPGHYFVLPSARPDGVPGEPLRQVVEILPGATTQLELDPELRPYGEVEVTLLVNGESPPKGFGVSFESGDQSYYDAVEVDGRGRMKLFVPAGDDYRVVVEPLDGSHMNAYVELRQTVDVKAGSNRFDFEIETCRVTCVIGELHHAALNNTWQFIRFQGPDGAERRGVEAGEHILGKVRPNAERNTIEVTFPYVPVWAKELRFQAEGRGAASKLEVPFRAALKKGASLRVTID